MESLHNEAGSNQRTWSLTETAREQHLRRDQQIAAMEAEANRLASRNRQDCL